MSGVVAAVNLSRGSTRDYSAGITVAVLSPRSQGLAACQALAGEAAVLLSGVGGDWSFEGWEYDSTLDCFQVKVEGSAVFSGQDDGVVVDEGYEVLIGDTAVPHVTEFIARKDAKRRLVRPHGQPEPIGVTPGTDGWSLELVQLLPWGEQEPEETGDGFTLTLRRGERATRYLTCCWAEYESRQREDGALVTRRGFALSREAE